MEDTMENDAAPLPQRVRRQRGVLRTQDSMKPEALNAQVPKKYEYLDHTADIQLHSWGDSLEEAFGNAVACMFNYITELDSVAIDHSQRVEICVEGHDLQSLLYNFMDECLFQFAADGFVCKAIEFVQFEAASAFSIRAVGHGETFDLAKHPRGTEVKAITFSNMQILSKETAQRNHQDRQQHACEIYVIVDI